MDISAALHLGIDYGLLHATSKICAIQDADNAFFINLATFEGASFAVQTTGSRRLRFQGSVFLANAARNAMFINKLICRCAMTVGTVSRLTTPSARLTQWPTVHRRPAASNLFAGQYRSPLYSTGLRSNSISSIKMHRLLLHNRRHH